MLTSVILDPIGEEFFVLYINEVFGLTVLCKVSVVHSFLILLFFFHIFLVSIKLHAWCYQRGGMCVVHK